MSNGFSINTQAIRQMTREIQREFDKHPIKVPVHADPTTGDRGAMTTNVYNGPVFNGDASGARIAWNNRDVVQGDTVNAQVAPGFETLAELLTRLVRDVPAFGLSEDEAVDATTLATEVLGEVVQEAPDRSVIRRGLRTLKGILAPIALKAASGAGEGASDLAREYVASLDLPM